MKARHTSDILPTHMSPQVERLCDLVEMEADFATDCYRDWALSSSEKTKYLNYHHIVAALNLVQNELSPYRFGYLQTFQHTFDNIDANIEARSGLCGHHVELFHQVMRKLGYTTRLIQFYGIEPSQYNHIGLEVWFNDSWHYVDVTWGGFFRYANAKPYELLSIEAIKALPLDNIMDALVVNQSNLVYQTYMNKGADPFEYVKTNQISVLTAGSGIFVLTSKPDDALTYQVAKNAPAFLGQYYFTLNNTLAHIHWELNPPQPVGYLTFHVTDCLVTGGFSGWLQVYSKNELAHETDMSHWQAGQITMPLPHPLEGPIRLEVMPKEEKPMPDWVNPVSYLTVEAITLVTAHTRVGV